MAMEANKILVDAVDLEWMLDKLYSAGSHIPERVRVAMDYYERNKSGRVLAWDVVEPRSGKNNLRAGATAYGRAVVVSTSPFLLASEDEKFTWEKLDPAHFTIVDRAPMALILSLNTKYGRYPVIG